MDADRSSKAILSRITKDSRAKAIRVERREKPWLSDQDA